MIICLIDTVDRYNLIVYGTSVFPGTMIYHIVKISAVYTL